jgi:hypothetical protein
MIWFDVVELCVYSVIRKGEATVLKDLDHKNVC